MAENMLTAKEIQALLQVDRSTVYRLAESGKMPALKVGRQWRFPATQIGDWLKMQAGDLPQPVPLPESQEQRLPALLPLNSVQQITDLLAGIFGVMIVVTEMDGRPVTQVSNPCGLFQAISAMPQAIERCIDDWHYLATTLDLEPRFRRSHLGLLCARGLVRVGSSLKGMVFVGGIAPDVWPPTPEEVAAIAADMGTSAGVLLPHMEEVFRCDARQRAWILSYVQRIADVLSHLASERAATPA